MRFHPYLTGLTALAVLAGSGAGEPPVAPADPVSAPAPAVETAPAQIELAAATTVTAVAAAAKHKYAFPVKGKNVSYHKTHSGYPATDIFAACGKPFLATTSGVVLEISRVDRYSKKKPDGPLNGGKFVSILGDDGVRYYGSHLSVVSAGLKKGVRVKVGQQVGKVGKTGNSSGVCHVHYGISPSCKKTGDWKVRRGVVWPATYLTSWRKGGQKSPAAAVKAWNKKKNCKA
ncbi:M23 family metallopeptidase [Actinoplanes sp. NEAU-A12]|uniref:M23 family metallopeptidase n=1 Tax=Actinoplanes sandaracinus TaxID=3045177 RepID=A0ABT6WCB6_9ACTN|nr:M23 family metallopeptidase [Actinoplanes sandaracinus]MDI6097384.1 M23 family metallopeptidase [Actinoplanes sandaracinus]